jgi:hypothetical protein
MAYKMLAIMTRQQTHIQRSNAIMRNFIDHVSRYSFTFPASICLNSSGPKGA